MSEGKKKLVDLAKAVKEKVTPQGDQHLQRRGLDLVEALSKDLTGDAAMPGLRLYRDAPSKFRLQRANRNAEITVEWQRDIAALAVTCEKHGEPKSLHRYVYDATKDVFRRMEGAGEIYEDLTGFLIEYLFPEAKTT
jgi:hypothetical protein